VGVAAQIISLFEQTHMMAFPEEIGSDYAGHTATYHRHPFHPYPISLYH